MHKQEDIWHLLDDLSVEVTTNKKEKSMKKATAPTVSLVHHRIVEESINKMRIAKCAYKIIMPDGTTHEHDPDNLFSSKPLRTRRQSKYPYGAMTRHFKPFVDTLAIGDVASIPVGQFDSQALLGGLSAWASTNWGTKSHQAAQNARARTVEIMRLK
jgi:hypothetical protein